MTVASQGAWPQAVAGYTANNWMCALAVLRLAGPLSACGIQLIEGNDDSGIYPERVSLADAVWIQRDFPRYHDAYEQVIDRARSEGKPVIFDIDDLIFELPADHPDRLNGYYEDSLVDMLRGLVDADAVTVSTEPLRAYYRAFNDNIVVLPNYLDGQVWRNLPLQRHRDAAAHEPVVIGYMGGESHLRDLEYIEPVLRRLAERYGKNLILRFYGGKPPAALVESFDLCPVEWLPLDSKDYRRFAELFAQARCDIAIAPLVDNPFNRCKSPIKFLEYSALSLPAVYSNIPPYSEVVSDGVTGLLAHTSDEWEQHLRELIDVPELRHKLGDNAFADIEQNWLLEDHAEQWRAAYSHIKTHMPAAHASTAARAVRQIKDWQRHGAPTKYGRQIDALRAEVNALNGEIALLRQAQRRVNEWAVGMLASAGQAASSDTESLLAAVAQQVTVLAASYRQADDLAATYRLQAARADQLQLHLAEIAQYAVYQRDIIQGLLNGRAMRTIMGVQSRLTRLRSGNRSAAPVSFHLAPPPVPLESVVQSAATDEPAQAILEPTALPYSHFKNRLTQLYSDMLSSFLATGQRLAFPLFDEPAVTIIIPVHNRAELTLQCLRSVKDSIHDGYEIIVVDDQSTDATRELLRRIDGIQVITNTENLHFLRSSNRAAAAARGEYLLFLNNDVQLLPGAIDAALSTLRDAPHGDIGAVGAKIILLDGTLQEAGSMIWGDATCLGYGRGDNPNAAPYNFVRDVDYCSGAFLLTPRALFNQLGGFDERFAPAYYEDTDYCLSLSDIGKRVVYTPHSVVLHYETASYQNTSTGGATLLQERHRVILLQKHAGRLLQHQSPDGPMAELTARFGADGHQKRILYIDDRVPHESLGAGFPRARNLLQALVESGYQVTLYPLMFPEEAWDSVYQEIPDTVEVMTGYGVADLEQFLEQRRQYYHTILVSRPHNARVFRQVLEQHPQWFQRIRIIYDAEAIYASREALRLRLNGGKIADDALAAQVKEEVDLARGFDAVLCVSESERIPFLEAGFKQVYVLGYAVQTAPTACDFGDRNGLLFVGAIPDDHAPNADAVHWFAREILPLIRQQLSADVTFTVVGQNGSEMVGALSSTDGIRFVGRVDDLIPYYSQARIFVAPTRYAAGIPLKVQHAAAHGVPVVCTSLLADELGWQPEVEVLVGDDPATFAAQCVRLYTEQALWETLRANALERVRRECSPDTFRNAIMGILDR